MTHHTIRRAFLAGLILAGILYAYGASARGSHGGTHSTSRGSHAIWNARTGR